MQKDAEIMRVLKSHFDKSPTIVWPAIVKSVEGLTCTVTFLTNDVTADEVRLRADTEATDGVLLTPKVGSLVLVATIENDLNNLFVCQVSEVDKVDVVIGKIKASMSTDGVTAADDKSTLTLASGLASLKQDQCELTMANGYVTIKNSNLNLKEVFADLVTLLQTFQVICAAPGAPSAAVFPATLTKVAQLKAKVDSLLA